MISKRDLQFMLREERKYATELQKSIVAIKEVYDWWQVDTYDRCGSVVYDAIEDAYKLVGENNK